MKIDFGLSSSNLDEAAKKAWPYDFGLIYSITFSKDELETSILVRNEGGEAWDFQVLMHTYLRIKVCFDVGIETWQHKEFSDEDISNNTDRISARSQFPASMKANT